MVSIKSWVSTLLIIAMFAGFMPVVNVSAREVNTGSEAVLSGTGGEVLSDTSEVTLAGAGEVVLSGTSEVLEDGSGLYEVYAEEGDTVSFGPSIMGDGEVDASYQWQKRNTVTGEYEDISARTEKLTIEVADADVNQEAQYRCVIDVAMAGTTVTTAAEFVITDEIPVCTSVEDMVQMVRDQMKVRKQYFTVILATDDPVIETAPMTNMVFAHTGDPREGDYLKNHSGYCDFSAEPVEQGTKYQFTMGGYVTTGAQEAVVDDAVKEIFKQIRKETEGMRRYEVLMYIYDWVKSNAGYDTYHYNNVFEHYNNMTKQTAYGALIDGFCVCEGYSSLFYRLALECGIDCRLITGSYTGGPHAWNIAEVTEEGEYYIFDVTTGYYLRGLDYYEDGGFHLDGKFLTEEFKAAHPIPELGYFGNVEEDISYTYDQETQTLTVHSDVPRVLNWDYYWPTEIRENTKHLVLDEGVTRVGDEAFHHFSALTSITMADTVKSLGDYAFQYCERLEDITLSDSLETIGKHCFRWTGHYEHPVEIELTLPDSVIIIEEGGLSSGIFTRIDISPNSKLTYIGDEAFNSSYITSIYIPSNVTHLGAGAFDGCRSLTKVEFAEDCRITRLNDRVFVGCDGLVEFEIPDSIISIGVEAFHGCDKFVDLSIPANVVAIGKGAFGNCENLINVEFPDNLTSIGEEAFFNCPLLGTVHIPGKVEKIGNAAFGRTDLVSLSVDPANPYFTCVDGVLFSADMKTLVAYPNRAGWTSYTVPEGVETLTDYAFCFSDLKTIHLPNSLQVIPDFAFADCYELTEITIPPNVTSIGTEAFYYCKNLKSLTIPGNVKTVGGRAFSTNYGLETVIVEEGVQQIYGSVFWDCENLQNIKLPLSLECLGYMGNAESLRIDYAGTEKQWLEIKREDSNALYEGQVTFAEDSDFTVSFDSNGSGETFDAVTLKQGDAYGTLPVPVRDGYTFYGWFTKPNGGAKVTVDSILATPADHTLYALWEDPVVASGKDGIMDWVLYKSGELVISGVGAMPDYDTKPVPWTDLRDQILTITVCDGITAIGKNAFMDCASATSFSLPETVESINDSAFDRCYNLKELTLPDSLKYISQLAFRGCDGITEAKLPAQLEFIGSYAFALMDNLTVVDIPESVTQFGDTIFYECNNLRSVTILAQAAWLGGGMFSGCDSLTEVTLTEGPIGIQLEAFKNCVSLKTITLPNSMTYIREYAFSGCTSLETVNFGTGLTEIDNNAFADCHSLKNLTLPAALQKIDSFAFANCTSLTELHIPDSVAYLGRGVFSGCTGLTSVEIPFGVDHIGVSAFMDCTNLQTVHYLANTDNIPIGTFAGCTALNTIHIASKVTDIFERAFENCDTLSSIYWNYTEKEWDAIRIGTANDALQTAVLNCQGSKTYPVTLDACGGITAVDTIQVSYSGFYGELPVPVRDGFYFKGWFTAPADGTMVTETTRVTKATAHTLYAQWWGVEASGAWNENFTWKFFGNGTLEISGSGPMPETTDAPWENLKHDIHHLIISDGITSISENVFKDYKTITAVDVASSVTEIGANAFYGCHSLHAISLPEGVTTIGDYAFYNCRKMLYVDLPSSCQNLGTHVFAYCDDLRSVDIAATGPYMFYWCRKLNDVSIREGTPYIAEYAFYWCDELPWKVTIPSTVTVIEPYAFSYSVHLTEVTLSEGLLEIGDHAFDRTILQSINLPETLTRIGEYAFYGCTFETITIPESVAEIGKSAFQGCINLKDIELNAQCTVLSESVFSDCGFSSIDIPASVKKIDWDTFRYNSALREIVFHGDAVEIKGSIWTGTVYTFEGATARAYYPDDNPTWTEDMFQDYGGALTWLPWYTMGSNPECEHVLTSEQVELANGDGYTLYSCACRYSFRADFLHTHTIVIDPAVSATCTESGLTEGSHCSVCDEILVPQEKIPALDHSYEMVVTDPTCTEGGYTTYTCFVCGDTYTDNKTTAKGHAYDADVVTTEPTCTEAGIKTVTCSTCGDNYTEEIPAREHRHAYTVTKDPTEMSTGIVTGTCAMCSGETTVTLPKLDEAYYDYAVTKEPSNTETGIGVYTWKDETCGTITIEVVLDKLAILYGDVNDDGRVNTQDRIILTRYLAKWKGYTEDSINLLAADVNADGKVNTQDRIILTRYLAKWTGYEALPYVNN